MSSSGAQYPGVPTSMDLATLCPSLMLKPKSGPDMLCCWPRAGLAYNPMMEAYGGHARYIAHAPAHRQATTDVRVMGLPWRGPRLVHDATNARTGNIDSVAWKHPGSEPACDTAGTLSRRTHRTASAWAAAPAAPPAACSPALCRDWRRPKCMWPTYKLRLSAFGVRTQTLPLVERHVGCVSLSPAGVRTILWQ